MIDTVDRREPQNPTASASFQNKLPTLAYRDQDCVLLIRSSIEKSAEQRRVEGRGDILQTLVSRGEHPTRHGVHDIDSLLWGDYEIPCAIQCLRASLVSVYRDGARHGGP